jgi:hypothetical protein
MTLLGRFSADLLKVGATKRPQLSIMYKKQNGLVINSKNLAKIYINETKVVIHSEWPG